MIISEIISFLNPITKNSSGEIESLPIFFFILIGAVFIGTIIAVKLNAKIENWKNNWQQDKNLAQLDIEQGSVMELSQLISTKSEKVADVMPGIILIIGLLGTFIGLGLALDKASLILGSANAESMDNSMAQLMGMMEGLGTKFKTSTWGLISFLLLKLILGTMGYENQRLKWCSEQTNAQLIASRDKKQTESEHFQQSLLNSIQTLEKEVVSSQFTHSDSLQNLLSNSHQAEQDLTKQSNTSLLSKLDETFNKAETLRNQHLQSMSDLFIQSIGELKTQLSSSIFNLKNEVTKEQKTNADLFVKSIGELKTQLSSSIFNLKDEVTKEQKTNADLFGQAIEKMNKALQQTLNQQHHENLTQSSEKHQQSIETLEQTITESRLSREAMERFVEGNAKTAQDLQRSAQEMSNASSSMGESAGKLQNVIDQLTEDMGQLMGQLKNDLGGTIENMDHSFSKNMLGMTESLTETIQNMNQSFRTNMTEMTQNLNRATQDISEAVNSLSQSVNHTMNEVSSNISKSMDLQIKSQLQFSSMTGALEEKVTAMTTLVERLSDDILSGLDKISESNRNMSNLNKRYNHSSEQIDTLINSVKTNIDLVEDFKKSIKDFVLSNNQLNQLTAEINLSNKNTTQLVSNLSTKFNSESIVDKLTQVKNELTSLNQKMATK